MVPIQFFLRKRINVKPHSFTSHTSFDKEYVFAFVCSFFHCFVHSFTLFRSFVLSLFVRSFFQWFFHSITSFRSILRPSNRSFIHSRKHVQRTETNKCAKQNATKVTGFKPVEENYLSIQIKVHRCKRLSKVTLAISSRLHISGICFPMMAGYVTTGKSRGQRVMSYGATEKHVMY